jgi:proline iminopeptidase
MYQFVIFFFFVISSINVFGQTLYSKSYGNSNNKPIIFIHGGPSGNSTLFEATTAQKIADNGFYVIVYDRRGEGRSIDTNAKFTYEEYLTDLNKIYETYKIDKANLIAHSFGGLVATLFSEKYPKKVQSLILAGSLISQQETYNHILNTVKEIYLSKNDSLMLNRVCSATMLDKKSAEYRKECFDLAYLNSFFEMPNPTEKSKKLREEYQSSDFFKSNIRNSLAPKLFFRNELNSNIDIKPVLLKLRKTNVKLFAVYGLQDKIFSAVQLKDLKRKVGRSNFRQIDNCSHYLFVDQQEEFIKTITKWIK